MLSIICEAEFKETTDSFTKSKSYPNLLANNHAENIYSNEFFNRFIMQISKSFQSSGTDETIKDLTEKIILEKIEIARENETEKYELVCLAISCLQCFVQANWLGPIPQQTSNLPAHLQKDEPTDIEKKLFFLKDFFNNEVIFIKTINFVSFIFSTYFNYIGIRGVSRQAKVLFVVRWRVLNAHSQVCPLHISG